MYIFLFLKFNKIIIIEKIMMMLMMMIINGATKGAPP